MLSDEDLSEHMEEKNTGDGAKRIYDQFEEYEEIERQHIKRHKHMTSQSREKVLYERERTDQLQMTGQKSTLKPCHFGINCRNIGRCKFWHSRSDFETHRKIHTVPQYLCNRCGSKYHAIQTCPYTICHTCGERGHMTSDCPRIHYRDYRSQSYSYSQPDKYKDSRYQNDQYIQPIKYDDQHKPLDSHSQPITYTDDRYENYRYGQPVTYTDDRYQNYRYGQPVTYTDDCYQNYRYGQPSQYSDDFYPNYQYEQDDCA